MATRSQFPTVDDLQRMRDTSDDRIELIEGEIIVTPSPSPMHQLVVHRLAVLFDRAIVESGLGLVLESTLDVFLAAGNVFQPDLVVLLHDRMQLFGSTMVDSAPSLTVEIISPSTSAYDRVTKRNVYAQFDVPEYWLVDPDAETVAIFSDPRDGRYRAEETTSDVAISATIPGLSADLKALFAPVPGL
jgi:Uma2 family endonuclease